MHGDAVEWVQLSAGCVVDIQDCVKLALAWDRIDLAKKIFLAEDVAPWTVSVSLHLFRDI